MPGCLAARLGAQLNDTHRKTVLRVSVSRLFTLWSVNILQEKTETDYI